MVEKALAGVVQEYIQLCNWAAGKCTSLRSKGHPQMCKVAMTIPLPLLHFGAPVLCVGNEATAGACGMDTLILLPSPIIWCLDWLT